MKATAATATVENVLITPADAPLERALEDGLPPLTHAQVEYWRHLCGVLSLLR